MKPVWVGDFEKQTPSGASRPEGLATYITRKGLQDLSEFGKVNKKTKPSEI